MILMLMTAWAATCDLNVPPDADFATAPPPAAEGAHLLIVVRNDNADPQAVDAIFNTLESYGLKATFSLKNIAHDEATQERAERLQKRGHDLAIRVASADISQNPDSGPAALRKTLRPFRSTLGRARVIEAGLGRQRTEAVLHRIGLRSVLETNGPASAVPRAQLHLEGQPNNGVILPSGPYAGPCGVSPVVAPFTPAAADRVTQALYGARSTPFGVVRLTLVPTSTDEAEILGRWLEAVVQKSNIPVLSATHARELALRVLREHPDTQPPPVALGGRLVDLEQVRFAARDLEGAIGIPRELSGELNPTEAFQAFLLLVAEQNEDAVVRLSALKGPKQLANSSLSGPVELSPEAVKKLAKALLAELPSSIPTAMSVDGQLLTAPELLVLLASMVRGGPPVAHPIRVPEPNLPGLGWGSSEAP